jgi:hypothetical protein
MMANECSDVVDEVDVVRNLPNVSGYWASELSLAWRARVSLRAEPKKKKPTAGMMVVVVVVVVQLPGHWQLSRLAVAAPWSHFGSFRATYSTAP